MFRKSFGCSCRSGDSGLWVTFVGSACGRMMEQVSDEASYELSCYFVINDLAYRIFRQGMRIVKQRIRVLGNS